MFLHLGHTKLEVYRASREFAFECYKLTKALPDEEKYAMASQIRRAALSVHLNIAEGSSRKSEVERKRYYEIARGSVIEIDAALDVANDLNYLKSFNSEKMGDTMIKMFKLLSGMIEPKH
jgi:four helix bundle protein